MEALWTPTHCASDLYVFVGTQETGRQFPVWVSPTEAWRDVISAPRFCFPESQWNQGSSFAGPFVLHLHRWKKTFFTSKKKHNHNHYTAWIIGIRLMVYVPTGTCFSPWPVNAWFGTLVCAVFSISIFICLSCCDKWRIKLQFEKPLDAQQN